MTTNNQLSFSRGTETPTKDGSPSQGNADPNNRYLKHSGRSSDNRWLVWLEQSIGTLPIREDGQLDSDIEPYLLTEDQKELLDEYEQAYETIHGLYDKIVRSFGYTPKFPWQ